MLAFVRQLFANLFERIKAAAAPQGTSLGDRRPVLLCLILMTPKPIPCFRYASHILHKQHLFNPLISQLIKPSSRYAFSGTSVCAAPSYSVTWISALRSVRAAAQFMVD